MKKESLILSAALLCSTGAFANALPEGMTALLPAGVTANISQNKQVYGQKNMAVAGSPEKGYKAFFSAKDTDHGEELWVTDGTPEGTKMVKDINPGLATSDIQWITRFNDKVVFTATDGENGYEPWISDGTEAGTHMLKDVHELESSNAKGYCQLNETQMIFYAMDFESEMAVEGTKMQYLWITDGTEDGTRMIKEVDCIFPGQEEADNRWGANMRVGRRVFFKAEEADKEGVTHGVELWVTDGTTEGTYLVKDINLEPNLGKNDGASTLSPALAHMQNFYNEKLFFKAWSMESGNEPWASDGTEEGTYEIFNTNPTVGDNGLGNGGGVTATGEPYNGEILFRSFSPEIGNELGATNLEKGNMKFFDIFTYEPTNTNNSYPDAGVVFDGLYMFCAATGFDAAVESHHGGELHCYDGEKVWLQYDFAPGVGSNWVKEPLVVGGSLYWWNEGNLDGTTATDTKLIRLDKADGVPQIVSNIDANGDKVYCLRNLNGDLLFTSAVNNQVYCYHYRQEGYDPAKNPDKMEIEYRTRKEIAESSGIDNITVDKRTVVSVSPNPATEYFTVNVDAPVQTVQIYSISGSLAKVVNAPENNTVNVSDVAPGIYMLSIETADGTCVSKLIVK